MEEINDNDSVENLTLNSFDYYENMMKNDQGSLHSSNNPNIKFFSSQKSYGENNH